MPDRIAEQQPPVSRERQLLDAIDALSLCVLTLAGDGLKKLRGVSVLDEEMARDLNHARNDLESLVEAAGRARRKAWLDR